MEREFKSPIGHIRVKGAMAEGEFNDLIEGIDVYVNGTFQCFLAETYVCDSNEVIEEVILKLI